MTKSIIRFKQGLVFAITDGYKTETRRLDGEPEYNVGDIVPIAESYGAIYRTLEGEEQVAFYKRLKAELNIDQPEHHPGWDNKLYIRPSLMRYRIQFIKKRKHLLHDITDKECMREGIFHGPVGCHDENGNEGDYTWLNAFREKKPNGEIVAHMEYKVYTNPREAFFDLFDFAAGSHISKTNPRVTAYSFKLLPTVSYVAMSSQP